MKIVILGNGISGITAARFVRKMSDHEIVVISKETDYFFSRTALMYLYMGHMRLKDVQPYETVFWQKNGIQLLRGEVLKIDFDQKQLHFNRNYSTDQTMIDRAPESLAYDKLVLAVGSATNKFGWPGQDLDRVQGLYSYQDVESMEKYSREISRAVIVGGGLIGIEMAEMFHSRHIPVTMLVRESNYWDIVLPPEESKMIGRHIVKHGIDLRLETELKEITGNDQGQATGVITNLGEKIDCQFVGLTAGVHPNISWLKESPLEIDRGILVDDHLQTNIKDVYAVGDCAQVRHPAIGRRNIEAVWYVGRMTGEVVAHNLCGSQVAYDPGIWFNSAKFFDIEYQVYGHVPVQSSDQLETLYWQEKDGNKSIRLVFDKNSEKITGFNLMGVRFRHEVCEKWISDETSIQKVLEDLALASFDPEFFPSYHDEVIRIYNQKYGKKIPIRRKRKYDLIFNFLNK